MIGRICDVVRAVVVPELGTHKYHTHVGTHLTPFFIYPMRKLGAAHAAAYQLDENRETKRVKKLAH